MQLNITGHHLEVTTPLREYVESKFERIQRHYDQITTTHVILTVEKMVQKAEATVHIAGADLFAHADDADSSSDNAFLRDNLPVRCGLRPSGRYRPQRR